MKKEESIITHPVPINVKEYGSFWMFSFKKANGYQAVIFGVLATIISFFILFQINLFDIPTLIGFALTLGFAVGIVTLLGVRGDTLLSTLINMIIFNRNKRTVYYNPRIKTDQLSMANNPVIGSSLPREKIQKIYRNIKKKLDQKIKDRAILSQASSEDVGEVIFADDLHLKEETNNNSFIPLRKGDNK